MRPSGARPRQDWNQDLP